MKDKVFQKIAKYVDKGYYIHFSDIFNLKLGKEKRFSKLGINPRYSHSTPFGIYAYPLTTNIFEQIIVRDQRIYLNDALNCFIIKPKEDKKYFYSSNFGKGEYAYLLEEFIKYSKFKDILNIRFFHSKVRLYLKQLTNNDYKKMENIFENLYKNIVDNIVNHGKISDENEHIFNLFVEDGFIEYRDIFEKTYSIEIFMERFIRISLMISGMISKKTWVFYASFIYKKIGIDGLIDNAGKGAIFSDEPTQAVFFFKDVLNVIEEITITNNAYDTFPRIEKHDLEREFLIKEPPLANDKPAKTHFGAQKRGIKKILNNVFLYFEKQINKDTIAIVDKNIESVLYFTIFKNKKSFRVRLEIGDKMSSTQKETSSKIIYNLQKNGFVRIDY